MAVDALALFKKYYEPAERYRKGLIPQWDEYKRAYDGEASSTKPSGDEAWKSDLNLKYAWQQVQTLSAALILEESPTFNWVASNKEQDQYSLSVEKIIADQLEQAEYFRKRLMSAETAAIYGACPVKYRWETTYAGGRVVSDHAQIDLIDPHLFFYDTRATSVKNMRYAGHELWLEKEELQAIKLADGSSKYTNLDKVHDTDSDPYANIQSNDPSGDKQQYRRKGVHIIEMCTPDRIITVANKSVVISDEENKLGVIPYAIITLIPSLNDVWGTSLVWAVRDSQDLIRSFDNALLDNMKLQADPPMMFDISDTDNAEKKFRPAQRYVLSAAEFARPINVTLIEPNSMQNALQSVRSLSKEITGVTDEIAGSSNADSATQAQINDRAARGRLAIMLHMLDYGWCDVARGFMSLCSRYLGLDEAVSVLGKDDAVEWIQVNKDMFEHPWRLKPRNIDEKASKQQHQEALMSVLQVIAPMEGHVTPLGNVIDVSGVVTRLLNLFNVDPKTVIVDADNLRQQHERDVLADAEAQARAQAATQPQPQPQAQQPQQAANE